MSVVPASAVGAWRHKWLLIGFGTLAGLAAVWLANARETPDPVLQRLRASAADDRHWSEYIDTIRESGFNETLTFTSSPVAVKGMLLSQLLPPRWEVEDIGDYAYFTNLDPGPIDVIAWTLSNPTVTIPHPTSTCEVNVHFRRPLWRKITDALGVH